MKAKKAVKRLNKVEALLSDVIDQFPAGQREVGELLSSAKASVIRARETVTSQLSTTARKRAPASAELPQQSKVAANGRLTRSRAASEQRAAPKRKGMNTQARRRLKKTA